MGVKYRDMYILFAIDVQVYLHVREQGQSKGHRSNMQGAELPRLVILVQSCTAVHSCNLSALL